MYVLYKALSLPERMEREGALTQGCYMFLLA